MRRRRPRMRPVRSISARAGIAPDAPAAPAPAQDRPDSPVEFSARAGFATDYIYRGVHALRPPAGGRRRVRSGAEHLLRRRHRRQRQAADAAGRRNQRDRRRASETGGRELRLRRDPLFLSRRDAPARRDRRHRLLGSRRACRYLARRVVPRGCRLRLFARTSPIPAPGASTRHSVSASTCRAARCRRT